MLNDSALNIKYYQRGKRKNHSKSPHTIYGLYGKGANGTYGVSGCQNA